VISLLNRVEWLRSTLKTLDREVSHKRNLVRTNLAGELYRRLHHARIAFLHGNPLADETLTLGDGKSILPYAGPLFRMALTAYLSLKFPELPSDADETARGRYVGERMKFNGPQRDCEAVILSTSAP
jgi:hypothetical protein